MPTKKTLKEKLVAVQEAHVEEELADQRERHAATQLESLLMVLGGVRAVNSVAEALSAQSIRALQRIRDEELYRATGHKRFDDFLDQSPLSPMSYKKFNRLETALLNEGDELFNYLNAIHAPMARRRLLGKGSLAIEGEEVILRQDKEEQRIPVGDRATLLSTLSRLADQYNERGRTIERQKRTLERGKEDFQKLQRQKNTESGRTPFADARTTAVVALGALAREAGHLTLIEREQARAETMALLQEQWMRLHEALGFATAPPPGTFSEFTANITDAQLEELEN